MLVKKNYRAKFRMIFLFAVCAIFSAFASETAPVNLGEAAPEFPADAEWIVGGAQKINDFGDKKLLLLYFGKAGCPSCDEFAPHLYRLLMKNEKDLRVVMVTPGIFPRREVEEYARDRKLGDYPIMRDAGKNYLPRFIGKILKFPYAALINREGKLIWFGRAKFHEQITYEVERALGKTAPANLTPPTSGAAVIIGVANPPTLSEPLHSPANDSQKIAAALQSRGYQTTLLNEKVARENVISAIEQARKTLAESGQLIVYFSGDALEIDGGRNLAFAFNDGDKSLAELIAAAGNRGIFIIDAAQADAFTGLNESNDRGARVFSDTIRRLGETFPQATILLSTARWDISQLLPDYSGTWFAQALSESLADGADSVAQLTREIAQRLADFSRRSGEMQSPAQFGEDGALLKVSATAAN